MEITKIIINFVIRNLIMYKTKRLLTNDEMDKFLKLREESNAKAAKYMKSLEQELFEIEEYDVVGTKGTGNKGRVFEGRED